MLNQRPIPCTQGQYPTFESYKIVLLEVFSNVFYTPPPNFTICTHAELTGPRNIHQTFIYISFIKPVNPRFTF